MARRKRGVGLQAIEIGCGPAVAAEILLTLYLLSAHLVPHLEENALQRVHLFALDAAVHVSPLSHLLRAFDIIIGHVHASCIGHQAINNHNFAVVTMKHMVDPRKTHRVKFIDFNASCTDALEMPALERLVVGIVAKAVEQRTHLYTCCCPFGQEVEEQVGNGVVAEIEILQMHAAPGLSDGFEQIVEFLLSVHQQCHGIILGKRNALLSQLAHNERVGCLCPCRLQRHDKTKQ